ncbi:hypothetical protein CAPTEDRAFT_173082 [Capitella teleta]|uniref:K Homology domain-containing protein n=1 Tax=Capitella teleta TaxID=283909 RepID=R7U8C2_CAPTE|nr:hypothetical protein CAPTEDRAFT_173082 [Capitella teleta]|eukprot:ELT99335.1 hypothetical protein CAPTEDRAFT_173082 [Capitella teleta]
MEAVDTRKRPLDTDSDTGVTKRSNPGSGRLSWIPVHSLTHRHCANISLKVLVPSIAAGAIIGKGGETITDIQKETGATVKMSKNNDFYPGTSERVCLVNGTLDSVRKVIVFIMERIREKPDPNPKPCEGEMKANYERHKQMKILVPNSTAGMVIGKGGAFIRQIKDDSGAYVQVSQKSKDMSLPERCVTIAGDTEQNREAIDLVLEKIMEDPQSASCPNISYADVKGPVASSNPTGSPFAAGSVFNNIGNGMNNLNLNTPQQQQQPPQQQQQQHRGGPGNSAGNIHPALENLKATLRASGYSEQATEEISSAMYTLANYGFLGLGLGLAGLGMGLGVPGGSGLLSGANNQGSNNGTADNNPNVFGPVGSTTMTNMSNQSDPGSSSSYFASSGDGYSAAGGMFDQKYNNGGFGGGSSENGGYTNQNSFGLGTGMMFSAKIDDMEEDDTGGAITKKEMEVGEHIVGAILGPGGKGIVELQRFTGTNIQISKKGIYVPGTRNRVVSITGTAGAVARAQSLIQQRISHEEAKRARQNNQQPPPAGSQPPSQQSPRQ